MTQFLIVFIFSMLGGIIYRIRGGMLPGFPRWLAISAFCVPFAIAAMQAPSALGMFSVPLVFILTFAAVATGHGRWQSLKEPLRGTPERTEFPILWLSTRLSAYWYKFLGLAMNGMLICTPLAAATLRPELLLIGLVKPVSYAVGWKISKGGTACELGEYQTGCWMWSLLANVIFERIFYP